jgi:hypothetical protein
MSEASVDSFLDSEKTMKDAQLNIPISKGVPENVPFATI